MSDYDQERSEDEGDSPGKAQEELRRHQEMYPSLYEEAMRHLREQEEKRDDEEN